MATREAKAEAVTAEEVKETSLLTTVPMVGAKELAEEAIEVAEAVLRMQVEIISSSTTLTNNNFSNKIWTLLLFRQAVKHKVELNNKNT